MTNKALDGVLIIDDPFCPDRDIKIDLAKAHDQWALFIAKRVSENSPIIITQSRVYKKDAPDTFINGDFSQ